MMRDPDKPMPLNAVPSLAAHPRLYASPAQLRRLKQPVKLRLLRDAARNVAKAADVYLNDTELKFDTGLHNSLLLRAREMQARVITLLVCWRQTDDVRYRDAAIRDVLAMGEWTYWGWVSSLKPDPRPEAEFDLSYGENSTTLAIAYDWLYDDLGDEQRQRFIAIARRWTVAPFLHHVRMPAGQGRPGWFGSPLTNWNSVCVGGAGLVALAMREDLPEADEILARVDESLTPYMQGLAKTNGGWVEGIGYWNYGHRYAFTYLLSHSRATGTTHPLLQGAGVKETLRFPLDFCPNGEPSSFGDVNLWNPLPFHFAAAEYLGARDVTSTLDAIMTARRPSVGPWPDDAELLILHPRRVAKIQKAAKSKPILKHYPSLDWFILADRLPAPRLYLSARGGTTNVPHSHRDLLSFHCVVGDEQLITNLGINGGVDYLDTTFSSRRNELFEVQPLSKNTILINGVGIATDATIASTLVSGRGFNGIRMDATSAMGVLGGDRPAATFCGRLFLMLGDQAMLILDRADLPTTGRVESRMHSRAACDLQEKSILVRGKRQKLRVTYASDVPSAAYLSVTAPTTPGPGANVLRWCTDARTHKSVTMATLLTPEATRAKLSFERDAERMTIAIRLGAKTWRVRSYLQLDHVENL